MHEAYQAGVTDVFEKQALDRLLTFIQRMLAQEQMITGRVMVVEDSTAMAALYGDMLRQRGLDVTICSEGESALRRLASEDFDLVVTDIVLGGLMSGITLVNQLRRIEGPRGEVPVLAVTAFDDSARRVELFRVGVNDYVNKPVAEEELLARTRNLIGHWRLQREHSRARYQAEAERESAHRELAYRASHDTLTGLANRWVLEQELAALLADPSRAATHGVALIDMSTLHLINDSSGREAGDGFLKGLAERLAAAAPTGSLAARLEGGRFAVVLPAAATGDVGLALEALATAVESYEYFWGDCRMPVHASVGALASLSGLDSVAECFSRCEIAVTASRSGGSRGLLLYDLDDERILSRERERRSLPSLINALDSRQIALHMQPIAPLREGLVGGYEFLCRLVARDGQLRQPADFLPAAERYGLMPRLDRLVTEVVLEWLAAHHRTHDDQRFFTINLSGQTISDASFCTFVREALQRTGAPAQRVYFEITETAVLADVTTAFAFMREMTDLGCRFALDDFGSGTATYGQLKQLPVHMLKIDGQFVRGMADNPVDLAIIRSTCEIARVMNLTTVAEFVDSEDEARQLAALGVDYGQGYGLGRPAPAG